MAILEAAFQNELSNVGECYLFSLLFLVFKWLKLSYMFSRVVWFYSVAQRDGEADYYVLTEPFDIKSVAVMKSGFFCVGVKALSRFFVV